MEVDIVEGWEGERYGVWWRYVSRLGVEEGGRRAMLEDGKEREV